MSKEKLLQVGVGLGLAKGYSAMTVDEVCALARVSKGSFFHYFKSKEDFGKALLAFFFTAATEGAKSADFVSLQDPLKRLLAYVDFIANCSLDEAMPMGCLLGNFAQELAQGKSDLGHDCNLYFKQWIDSVNKDLEAAKKAYAPESDVETSELAEMFVALFEGSQILAKSLQSRRKVYQQLQHFKRYLSSIFGNNAAAIT